MSTQALPYAHLGLPQYETERILDEFLARFGTAVERGTELVSFAQDANGVTSRLLHGLVECVVGDVGVATDAADHDVDTLAAVDHVVA